MNVISDHRAWNAPHTAARLCSALLAAAVTLLLILLLSQPLHLKTHDAVRYPVPAMLLQFPLNIRDVVDAAKDAPVMTAPAAETVRQVRKKSDTRADTSSDTSTTTLSSAAVPAGETSAAIDSITVTPGPATLDISRQTIARAYQASKSELQQRAEASGRTLNNTGPDKYERLQKDLQQATIPGCTDEDALKHRPAKIGGVAFIGLLAAPFWAQAAMSGKCR